MSTALQKEGGDKYSLTPYHRLLKCLPRVDFSNFGCLPALRLAGQAGGSHRGLENSDYTCSTLAFLTCKRVTPVRRIFNCTLDIVRWTSYVRLRTLDVVRWTGSHSHYMCFVQILLCSGGWPLSTALRTRTFEMPVPGRTFPTLVVYQPVVLSGRRAEEKSFTGVDRSQRLRNSCMFM